MRGDPKTFTTAVAGLAIAKIPRRYTGIVTAQNDDGAEDGDGGGGSYQVIVNELNVGYPRVYRSGSDRRRLTPRERVTIWQTGVVLEIE